MKCLLIGVSHGYQYEGNKSVDIAAFNDLLKNEQALHNANLLAEELNNETIHNTIINGITGSVAEKISLKAGISHKFCDPTEKERKLLGIPTSREIKKKLGFDKLPCLTWQQAMEIEHEEKIYWEVREQFWLEKLIETSKDRAIFILGAKHVHRFKKLLEISEIKTQILYEHWMP